MENVLRVKLLIYAAACMTLIFTLPYFVPVRMAASPSYVLGYNNQFGVLLLLMSLVVGVFIAKGSDFQFLRRSEPKPVPVKILYAALLLVFFACGAMYLLAGRFDGFGEFAYEIDRIRLVADGRAPYVHFEWPFGVSLLYMPLLISRATGLNIIQSYFAFWLVNCLLGVVCLFALVNLVDYPTSRRSAIFIALVAALSSTIVFMGTHYGFLRQVAPLLGVLIVSNTLRSGGRKAQYRSVFISITFAALLLLLSPETAIALALACGFMLFYAGGRSGDPLQLGGAVLAVIAFAGLFAIAYRLGALNTLLASGGGADSFPILASLHIVLFFGATAICAFYLYRRLSEGSANDNTFALLLYSIPMLAPALGRCDPTHVFLNGLGIFIAVLFYLSNSLKFWKLCSFIVIFVFILNASNLRVYRYGLERALLLDLSQSEMFKHQLHSLKGWAGDVKLAAKLGALAAMDLNAPLSVVYPDWHGEFLAPFGYARVLGTYYSSQIEFGFYEGFENANTPSAIARKIEELKGAPQRAVLLPGNFEALCGIDAIANRRIISALFMRPYNGAIKNSINIRKPVCDYIRANYVLTEQPLEENFGFGLWVPSHLAPPQPPTIL